MLLLFPPHTSCLIASQCRQEQQAYACHYSHTAEPADDSHLGVSVLGLQDCSATATASPMPQSEVCCGDPQLPNQAKGPTPSTDSCTFVMNVLADGVHVRPPQHPALHAHTNGSVMNMLSPRTRRSSDSGILQHMIHPNSSGVGSVMQSSCVQE